MAIPLRSLVPLAFLAVAGLPGLRTGSRGSVAGRAESAVSAGRMPADTVPIGVADTVAVSSALAGDTADTAAAPTTGTGDLSVDTAADFVIPTALPVPFGPGERLTYDVKMGLFSVGSGSMSVLGVDTVQGALTYHLDMQLQGGIPMARVDDHFESWLDVATLASRRFVQRIREARYKADRHFEIYPSEKRWERIDDHDSGPMVTSFPLDDISFIYYVRTLDLTPGKEYRFRRYFKEDGNPVVVKVVGRDTVSVPAGTFPTVVVRPVIQTTGLFGEGGEAELYFTDDENHYLVYMRVKMPVVRSMTLHLSAIHPGHRVWKGADQPDAATDPPGAG